MTFLSPNQQCQSTEGFRGKVIDNSVTVLIRIIIFVIVFVIISVSFVSSYKAFLC